jgi:dihydrofolate reductase
VTTKIDQRKLSRFKLLTGSFGACPNCGFGGSSRARSIVNKRFDPFTFDPFTFVDPFTFSFTFSPALGMPIESWNGWWGVNPPFHHPVFVLTHHARGSLELEGGTTFTFVAEGIEAALEQARRAAGGKDVSLAGGARAAQQYLAAGLVDEMEINVVPTLFGSGERLFNGVGADLHGLELVRTIATPKVTRDNFY